MKVSLEVKVGSKDINVIVKFGFQKEDQSKDQEIRSEKGGKDGVIRNKLEKDGIKYMILMIYKSLVRNGGVVCRFWKSVFFLNLGFGFGIQMFIFKDVYFRLVSFF